MTLRPASGSRGIEQLPELHVEVGEPGVLGVDLRLEVLAHLGVVLRREQLAGVREIAFRSAVLAVRVDDRLDLGVATAGFARGVLVAGRVDLRQPRFELLELGLQFGEPIEHGRQGSDAGLLGQIVERLAPQDEKPSCSARSAGSSGIAANS